MAAQVSRVEEIQINGNTYLTSSVAICFPCVMLRWCHANTSFLYVGTPSTHSSHLHAMYICTMFLHNRFYHNFPFMHEFVLKFYWSVRHSRVAPPSTATNSPAAAEQHLSDSAYVFVLYSSEIYSGEVNEMGRMQIGTRFPQTSSTRLSIESKSCCSAPSLGSFHSSPHPPSLAIEVMFLPLFSFNFASDLKAGGRTQTHSVCTAFSEGNLCFSFKFKLKLFERKILNIYILS